MSDQDLNNLTGQDLKLVTIILYRISKKGIKKLTQIILPHLKELQKFPNGFHQFNSEFNSNHRMHKSHIPQVKSAQITYKLPQRSIGLAKNQNVKNFFQQSAQYIQKMRSDTFNLNCPKNQLNDKKFAVHSYQSPSQRLVNPKLKYGHQQLKSLSSEQAYKIRNQIIKQIEQIQIKQPTIYTIKTQQSLFDGMKTSALFSSGISVAINFKDLLNKQYLKFFSNVGKDILIGGTGCVLNNSLKSLGKRGGLITTVTIGSVLNLISLVNSNDWHRFGLNTCATVASAATGYAGCQLGAAIGLPFGPIGIAVGGAIGGLIGGLAGNKIFSSLANSDQLTYIQLQTVQKEKLAQIKKISSLINKDIQRIGQQVDLSGDIVSLVQKNQIMIKQKSIDQIYKVDKSYLTKQMTQFYKQIIRPVIIIAKSVSPTQNVSQGLKIMIKMTQKFE